MAILNLLVPEMIADVYESEFVDYFNIAQVLTFQTLQIQTIFDLKTCCPTEVV